MKRSFFATLIFLSTFLLSEAQPKYEFRGVWIATVTNIDWPRPNNFEPDRQKKEFIQILDMHQRNGMNAMIVQVRPSADAFYPSAYEPWSQWLTGVQGKPPVPYYDPLAFMIEETHKRGMEFHAWLNPYRANFNIVKASISPSHITNRHPEWFLTYGDKKYFDPGNKEAQKFVVNVVQDIVRRYDIDAIHMDDYFYPYRIPGKEFPDERSYRSSGSPLNKDDWRRSNTDSIIKALNGVIKKEKRLCRFGISPFSVWRNKEMDPVRGSETRAGQTNYDDLYADILLWLEKGWIDYVTPQLYFTIDHPKVSFSTMVDWWSQNGFGKHVYIGHGLYKALTREPGWKNRDELPEQIKLLRDNPDVQGSIYYSSSTFNNNPNGWNDSLRYNYYKYPALLPPMPWIDEEIPETPLIEKSIWADSLLQLNAKPGSRNPVEIKYYVVYQLAAHTPDEKIDTRPEYISRFVTTPKGFSLRESLTGQHVKYHYLITAVGRNNMESAPVEIRIQRRNGKWTFY